VQASYNFDLRVFAVGCAVLALGWISYATIDYIALRVKVNDAAFIHVVGIVYSSQIFKYLPGGLWAIPGRTVMFQQQYQMKALDALFVVLWESGYLLLVALTIGCGGSLLVMDLPTWFGYVNGLVMLGIITLGIAALLHQRLRPLLQKSPIKLLQKLDHQLSQVFFLSARQIMQVVAVGAVFWTLTGIGFHFVIRSVLGDALPLVWYQSVVVFSMAYAFGYLIVIVPAGLGIRESVIVLLLTPLTSPGEAVFIAALARFWWTIVDFTWILSGIALYYFLVVPNTPKPETEDDIS